MTMQTQLTNEQKTVTSYALKAGEVLKVNAFAGTGKTTTLIEFSHNFPRQRFLYIAFNKSVQLEASSKFPGNVTCKTAHSLAWRDFGARYRHKLSPSLKVNTVAESLGLPYTEAKFTLDTLYQFLVSGDGRIYGGHIPFMARNIYPTGQCPDFVQYARHLWILMTDPNNKVVPMIHDGYLKLFQLSSPKLAYDCILLDEAQDTNPATAALVFSQSCAKVLVGDPHQAIYGFRGAIDAMEKIEADKTLYLTHSFRFGERIASVANALLSGLKEEKHSVTGVNRGDQIRKVEGRYCVLCRTNASVFEDAINMLNYTTSFGFVGGIQGYRFELLTDTYHLMQKNKRQVRDRYMASFRSYDSLKEYADSVEDLELLSRCRVVEKHQHDIPELVRRIHNKAVAVNQAKVLISTAHKAKGLEFDQVRLASDFPPLLEEKNIKDDILPEEVNLLYVASTRAKKALQLNEQLADYLNFYNEK